ncbi:8249_t:CDS:2, partial [Acaulospora morrowiae]
MNLQAVIYDSLNQGRAITVSLPGYSYGTVVDHYKKPNIKNFLVDIKKRQLQTTREKNNPARVEVIENDEKDQRLKTSEYTVDPSDPSGSDVIDDQEVRDATDDKVEEAKKKKTGPIKLSKENRKEVDEWRELEHEHAVHSFILDIDDELVADCFTEAELREIELTPIPEVPELSDE